MATIVPRALRSLAMAAEPLVAAKMVPIPRRGVDYRGKVVLAPMVRSGELPSRLLALHYGADLVWGPETVDYSMIGTTRRVNSATGTVEWTRKPSQGQKTPPQDAKESAMFKMHPEREGKRLIFQLGTSDPVRAVEVARLVGADVAGVDVNAGCPKPFSISGGMGAALLREPDRLCAILEALVRELTPPPFEIGVSVKIRVLDSPADTEALVRRLVATGITGLTVHCRTPPMRPREPAIRGQLPMVAAICHDAGVACLMNGDVEDRDKAVDLAREFGADGGMIATAAEKNPSCFRSAVDGGPEPWQEAVRRYIEIAMDTENRFGNTKYLLGVMVPGRVPQYQLTQRSKTYVELCEALGLTDLLDSARDLDVRMELGVPPPPKAKKSKQKKNNPAALASGGNMAEARKTTANRKNLSARGVNRSTPPLPHPPPAVEQPAVLPV